MNRAAVTPGWKFVSIGFEADNVELEGLNPWKTKWNSLEEEPIVVAASELP